MFPGRVWITFSRDMHIMLKRPLDVKSFTTIDAAAPTSTSPTAPISCFTYDTRMRVTIAFNRFGPNCKQRMPRSHFEHLLYFTLMEIDQPLCHRRQWKPPSSETGFGLANPRYNTQQRFAAASAKAMRSLTRNADVLHCSALARC
ncbi:hypothetical protein Cni_G26483 [Canna indica]|uniref:Uncharacterized protein n=1 Tax=Canna indica TaxID=4628 RepID=A0AAQ3KZU6_9LILI|nr:hypothetical protein Cni_G26483 [Canna indica]